MERADVESVAQSLEGIRSAYRREVELGEDPEFADDLLEIIDITERWLLEQIGGAP